MADDCRARTIYWFRIFADFQEASVSMQMRMTDFERLYRILQSKDLDIMNPNSVDIWHHIRLVAQNYGDR